MRWAKWVRKLNQLGFSQATRAFYTELKRKNFEEEQSGPIVNEKGQLSTSLKECITNWENYYKKLYSKAKEDENTEKKEEDETNNHISWLKLNTDQEEALNKKITMTEVVDALFSLRTNTTAGKDSILTRDVQELLDTSKQTENWKNVEMLRFLHKMLQNMWKTNN